VTTQHESPFVIVDETRRPDRRTTERFDRIAFAMHALRIVRPEHMRVAVYTRASNLRVERGRDFAADDASWALIGIPPDASRQSIALALAELVGLSNAPFMVDLLCVAAAAVES
jgi:hypothetical protein